MDINVTIIGQMITFIIFVWFTMKFIWPLLNKSLEERRNKIAEGIAFADRAARELEVSKRQSTEILLEAKAKATEIIENAYIKAHKIDEQSKYEAIAIAEKIKTIALAEIEQEKTKVKEQMKKELISLSTSIANKIIKLNINEKLNKKILEEFIEKV